MTDYLSKIQAAVAALRQGQMIILQDESDRENEGDLVLAAQHANANNINFMLQHGGGLVCMPITTQRAEQLQLDMQPLRNDDALQQAPFTVTIDAAKGNTTGISAADRARTIQAAVASDAKPYNLVTPGHVFPLRAKSRGVFDRMGHTEGSIDLMRIAGLEPAAVICEVLNAHNGEAANGDELRALSEQHGLPMVSMLDILTYRLHHEQVVTPLATAKMPLNNGTDFECVSFETLLDDEEHVALVNRQFTNAEAPLVRVHSECLTGDIFGSARCDCGWQLHSSLERLSQEGGVLCYLRQEGRGIGLGNKIRAYALQDKGADTVEANLSLGFGEDERDYCIAAQMLKQLGYTRIRLLTNNPRKIAGLQAHGIEVVERIAIQSCPTPQNKLYLQTKRDKLGHLLEFDL